MPGLIYVGTDKGAFWVSEDDGKQWQERSNNLPVGYIRSIFPSRYSDSRVYVAVTGINYDDLNTYLFCSEDCGVTWRSISANLPNEPANVVVEDPLHEDVLYAGTFRGVYLSTDRGVSWSLLGRNLPACCISDIVVQQRTKDLVVATHGRGIYQINLAPVYESHVKQLSSGVDDYLFPIPTAVRPYLSDTRPGVNFSEFEKTPITYWLNKAGTLKVSVLKPDGDSVASFALSGSRGLNQFRWDLVLKTTSSPAPYFINYKQYLEPGRYRIQVKVDNGDLMERELNVIDDMKKD